MYFQPLIPTQKVRSTGQLVEKILGRSTEKSYHESGGKVIMKVGENWKFLAWNTYEISANAGFA